MSESIESRASIEIHEWISKDLLKREVGTANRASSAPSCVRKRWFQNQGVKGEPMGPRSIIVFAFGDATEHIIKYFIAKACVGPGKLYSEVDFGEKDGTFTIQHREFDIYKQETLTYTIGGIPVTAHADGWGKRNSDGRWELLEVKSASFQGFAKFVKGEASYIKQVHALMMSPKAKELKADTARFFFMNKNNSDIFDRLYPYNPALAYEVDQEFKMAAGPSKPSIPIDDPDIGFQEALYRGKPTGKKTLGYKCGYCEYKTTECFPEAKLDFKSGKPIWLQTEGTTNG